MNLAGIEKAFNKQLKESPLPGSDVEWDKSFYIGDLEELRRQHLKWKTLLPRIEPFYAIKCNPDPIVAKFLASLGVGFDCASQSEIQQVLEMGLSEDQIVYSHPHKNPSSIQYAAQNNVSLMSIDSETELYKIKKFYPDAKLLLRVLVDDKYCAIPQGIKFGAMEDDIEHLLSISKELKLNVVGACFHVGSGCTNAEAYYDAVCRARRVFDLAKSMDIEMNILNIGGGFNESGITEGGATFEKAAAVLGPAVDEMFPSNIRVIGEPGRFFVGSAFVLCVSVIGRQTVIPGADEMEKDVKSGKQSSKYMYYINDGFFGSFNMLCHNPQRLSLKVLRKDGIFLYGHEFSREEKYTSTIWGQACTSLDCVSKEAQLPVLNAGDWIYITNVGAYTRAVASTFNGFEVPKVVYVNNDL